MYFVKAHIEFRVFDKNTGKDVTNDYEFVLTHKGEIKQVYAGFIITPPENLDIRIIMDVVVRDVT